MTNITENGIYYRVEENRAIFDSCEELEGEVDGMLFVERKTVEKEYPIPSAFAAYAKHLNIVLGNKK